MWTETAEQCYRASGAHRLLQSTFWQQGRVFATDQHLGTTERLKFGEDDLLQSGARQGSSITKSGACLLQPC